MLRKYSPAVQKSENQTKYIHAIRTNTVVICVGYAGTGKTFLALSEALRCLSRNPETYQKIVIIRPYIPSNTGEKIGALPGDLREKVAPYIESIRDNLRKLVSFNEVDSIIQHKMEFTVLSMCRGRSFNNCIVIVEEAQNVPVDGDSMKMLLTRIGEDCKMLICGDVDQIDLPGGKSQSALEPTCELLRGVSKLKIVEMYDYEDIQRSPLVRDILERYRDGDENDFGV